MGATNCSISSGLNTAAGSWASRRKGDGQTRSMARSQTRSCWKLWFIVIPLHPLDRSIVAHTDIQRGEFEEEYSTTEKCSLLDHGPRDLGLKSNGWFDTSMIIFFRRYE